LWLGAGALAGGWRTLPPVAGWSAGLAVAADETGANSPPPDALPTELTRELPGARLHGQAELRFFGLAVYTIRLWSTEPPSRWRADWSTAPLALEVRYARSFEGRRIAERSLDEMRRQGDLSAEQASRWLDAMVSAFPDVRAGDRITGVQQPDTATVFYANGRRVARIDDPAFSRRFFGIWLSPRTSEPALRARLLGESRS